MYRPSPDLVELIEKLLPGEKEAFFASLDKQLPHTIRFNSLKGDPEHLAAFLRQQGFGFELFPGFDDIYRLTYQPYPIGKSLSHFLGHFYVQDVASMIPPRVLNPQPGETVLDMSAAPGSKTTQMAVMMQNQGAILANDIVQKRLKALINNLQRMGIVNTAVVKNYGESFGNRYFQVFDKILLDPACSGLGTLHKSPEVLSWWTPAHCVRLARSQKQLIKSAVKALKPGGVLVYSTCTLTPEENEEIIDFALREFPVELEPIDLPELKVRPGLTAFENKVFDQRLSKALRLYPFENQTEGFFIAKLRKTGAAQQTASRKETKPLTLGFISDRTSPVKKYLDYLAQHFGIQREVFSRYRYFIDKRITVVSTELAAFPFKSRPMKTGLTMGRPLTQAAKLTTEGTHLFGEFATSNVLEISDPGLLQKFVNREEVELTIGGNGQVMVIWEGIPIGYGLADDGRLKSQFPKAGWPFQLPPQD